jgi:hypothetical protein
MKFREFEVDIKSHEGNEYLVISQKNVDTETGVLTNSYVTLERHQLDSLLHALFVLDGK